MQLEYCLPYPQCLTTDWHRRDEIRDIYDCELHNITNNTTNKVNVKFSHTHYQALGPKLIPM